MKSRIVWVGAGAAAGILLATLIFWGWRSFWEWKELPVQTLDSPAVVHEIQRLSELVSVKYTVQKVVGLEEQKIPLGSEKLLLIVQAEVLAGIDLSKVTGGDIKTLSDGRIKLTLPPARIVHVIIDDTQTKVWDRQITWWTPWVPFNKDLERQVRLAARESIEKAAIESGILDQARRNAETTLRTFLETLGVKSLVVEQSSSGA